MVVQQSVINAIKHLQRVLGKGGCRVEGGKGACGVGGGEVKEALAHRVRC